MRLYNKSNWFVGLLAVLMVMNITLSCKKKEKSSSEYAKQLSELATKLNKSCPKNKANGTRLESVAFVDCTLVYRLSLSDQAIVTVNLDNARDSIIRNMSDDLKNALIKGNCSLEYKYVSKNDSSSITIVPNELKNK